MLTTNVTKTVSCAAVVWQVPASIPFMPLDQR
jgi:hypothetical protein